MGIRYEDIVKLQKDKLEVERLRSKGFTYVDIMEMLSTDKKSLEVLKRIPIIC